jgi:hypothetical protein
MAGRGRVGRIAPAVAVAIAVLAAGAAHGQRAAGSVVVTVAASGAGEVAFSTGDSPCRAARCTVTVAPGTAITLTAKPDADDHLEGWGGACVGTATACRVVASSSLSVGVSFASGVAMLPPLAELDVTRSPGGTVTSDPAGTIACGTLCLAWLTTGTALTLNAAADAGSTFLGWSGACSGTGPCTVTLTGRMQVSALFRDLTIPAGSSVVTIVNDNPAAPATPGLGGTVGVTTPGLSTTCPVSTCSYTIPNETSLQLDGNGAFPTWAAGCVGSASRCSIVVAGATTITVSFPTRINAITSFGVNVSRTSGGQITSVPPGVKCGDQSGCAAAFAENTNVALTAVADPKYAFLGWSGDCSGTATCTVVADATRSVVATFGSASVSLSVARTGSGRGTVSTADGSIECGGTCSAAFDRGVRVSFRADALPGSTFAGWSGACAGAGVGVCTFAPTAGATVGARFERCALSALPLLTATATGRPRKVRAAFALVGPATVAVRLLRNGRPAAPVVRRKVAAGRSAFSFALPAKAPHGGYLAEATVTDACGGRRVLRRSVTA